MHRGKPKSQAQDFVGWLLPYVGALEFAAAFYGANGRVANVIPCRMPVKCCDDFERVYPWLALKNAGGHNIWCRPHSQFAPRHPLLLLDDVAPAMADRIAARYMAAVVETRPGNCQVWTLADRQLSREQRQDVLRALARLAGADQGATSEPRWARCPGFSGKKRGDSGVWVNLLSRSGHDGRRFDPSPYIVDGARAAGALFPAGGRVALSPTPTWRRDGGAEADRSLQHFAYSVHALRAGVPPEIVVRRVASRALADGKRRDARAAAVYAERTVRAAGLAVRLDPLPEPFAKGPGKPCANPSRKALAI